MKADEIFANRRAVAQKICKSIREKNGQLTNSKYFYERPYYLQMCSELGLR